MELNESNTLDINCLCSEFDEKAFRSLRYMYVLSGYYSAKYQYIKICEHTGIERTGRYFVLVILRSIIVKPVKSKNNKRYRIPVVFVYSGVDIID